jgi:hypothetical protein
MSRKSTRNSLGFVRNCKEFTRIYEELPGIDREFTRIPENSWKNMRNMPGFPGMNQEYQEYTRNPRNVRNFTRTPSKQPGILGFNQEFLSKFTRITRITRSLRNPPGVGGKCKVLDPGHHIQCGEGNSVCEQEQCVRTEMACGSTHLVQAPTLIDI